MIYARLTVNGIKMASLQPHCVGYQRRRRYERKALDNYDTTVWMTAALMPHIPNPQHVWEPADGNGLMVRALCATGHLRRPLDPKWV